MKNWSNLRSHFPRRSPWSADSRSHRCRHTGSLAWGHIGHTSHHSIWHASNIFATCVGAYRDSGGGAVENRAGDHERSACCTHTHYNVRWCAVIDERDMHPPGTSFLGQPQSQITLLITRYVRRHKSREENSTIYTCTTRTGWHWLMPRGTSPRDRNFSAGTVQPF